MAVTVKADTEDFPSILAMFGLNGMPADHAPTSAPESQPPDSADAPKGKTPSKLQLLQHTLAGGSHDDAAAVAQGQTPPIDPAIQGAPDAGQPLNPGQGEVLPPARNLRDIIGGTDPSQLIAAAQGNNTFQAAQPDQMPATAAPGSRALPAKPNTFQSNHPTLAKILNIAATLGAGAGAGAGARDFGSGFQRGAEIADPIKKKMQDIALAEKQAGVAHTQAATEQLKSQVTLPNGLTVPFALAQKLYPAELAEMGKNDRNKANIDSRESIAGDKNALALRSKGLKLDANGKQVPLSRDEMSETEQAHLDLVKSQQDAAAARAEMDRAANDPNSPKYKAAMMRYNVAQQNASTAAGRLGLAKDTFNANYFGTGPNGEALPGATVDDQGRPIGPRMANAAKVPADRLKRGDLASNAISNLDDIVGMIHQNPELFGSLSGRITTAREMMGSDEPAIRQIAIAAHNYALASAGVHGTRSQGAVEKTENELLNHWKDGDVAVLGGISQAKKSLQQFVENQRLGNKPIPKAGATKQQQTTAPPAGASDEVYASDGKTLIGHAVNGKYVPLQTKR